MAYVARNINANPTPPGPASGKSGWLHINANQPGNCDAGNESPSSGTAWTDFTDQNGSSNGNVAPVSERTSADDRA